MFGYAIKEIGVALLIIAAIVGFVGFIANEVAHSEKCTCEMVKNHECP